MQNALNTGRGSKIRTHNKGFGVLYALYHYPINITTSYCWLFASRIAILQNINIYKYQYPSFTDIHILYSVALASV